MKRRLFIQQTAALAGGLLLQQPARLMGTATTAEKISVLVIGCGDRGNGLVRVLQTLSDRFQVTAICDVLDFRIEQAKKLNGSGTWKVYRDYRKGLEDKSVQAVVIATPLHMHYPIAADAMKAGKHVYLEKTMTYDIPGAIELVQLARRHTQQVVQVGHQYRYTPLYFRVKEMIQKGYLG